MAGAPNSQTPKNSLTLSRAVWRVVANNPEMLISWCPNVIMLNEYNILAQ